MKEQTTRQRNIWIGKQVQAGRSIGEVAQEAKLPEKRVQGIVDSMKEGRLGPGRPNKPEEAESWESRLGQGFRDARNKSGMTMRELIEKAKEPGINADLISRFERGGKQPNMKQLQDMCRVVGITIQDIWPKERNRSQSSEMKRAGHLRPSELVDVSALLGKAGRERNERKQVGRERR